MSSTVNTGKATLLCYILAIFAAFQIVLLYLYGESIIAIDMYVNLVTTNPGEAGELLGNLAFALVLVSVLYFPPLIWAIYLIIKRIKATKRQLRLPHLVGFCVTCLGLILLISSYIFVPGYKIKRELFPVNVLHNMYTAIVRTVDTQKYSTTSFDFNYRATPTRDKETREIYVLVIGETSRADNWQIMGYERPTNPRLSLLADSLALFPKAMSESNITHKAVPLLLSHLTSENFGDSIYYTKSIISAFNQAGYNTAFISNQKRNHSFIDFFANESQRLEFIGDNHHGPLHVFDTELVPRLRDVIAKSSSHKIFVVLHCYGSHFNYRERYDDKYRVFTPDNSSQADMSNRSQLLNAYDNTIVMTDELLAEIIQTLESENCHAAMMYLSDHGEDIFDDSRGRFLHSSPTPTFQQLHVPFFIWMSDSYREAYPGIAGNLNSHSGDDVSTSRSVFHTLLSIGGIESPYYNPEASLAERNYKIGRRLFLNDYNEGVDYEHAGFREPDFQRLDSLKINYRQP